VTEKWQGGEHTEWYRCVLFGDRAERIASWFRKGDPLMVVGAMRTRKYQDRDGNERRTSELSVRDVQCLKSREQRQPAPQERPAQGAAVDDYGAEDDIPF
jgi:single-strand DNA-binding protein